MAQLGEGAWAWDGLERAWFLLRAYLVGLYADQPGSSKSNKMTDTQGRRGCRFCEIDAYYGHAQTKSTPNATVKSAIPSAEATTSAQPGEQATRTQKRKRAALSTSTQALASTQSRDIRREGEARNDPPITTAVNGGTEGEASNNSSVTPAMEGGTSTTSPVKWGKTPSFSLSTPPDLKLLPPNASRPAKYEAVALPLRSDDMLRSHIAQLQLASSKTEKKRVGTRTGVAALPLLATS
ncbi:hypothetical protein CF327_g1314 [Tilletia walkeri]|nr:hypothetical protein CF327_g1314 [Tilletia walkeri]